MVQKSVCIYALCVCYFKCLYVCMFVCYLVVCLVGNLCVCVTVVAT
jgi:hypothetical protein